MQAATPGRILPLPPADAAARDPKLWQAARTFEAMAIGQLLAPMFDTVDLSKSRFGGGQAEAAWRPMLVDAIGKQIEAHGGFGLAQPIYAAMLRAQEAGRQRAGAQQAGGQPAGAQQAGAQQAGAQPAGAPPRRARAGGAPAVAAGRPVPRPAAQQPETHP